IGGIAVDPSDPSGNTVYVAGASGGVWKTTNFLTTDFKGPTYVPLTDFGPTYAINAGSIAVFGRNNDPNQSEVFVATGEGDVGSAGVGILRSQNGGNTWLVLDSTKNVYDAGDVIPAGAKVGDPLPMISPLRDHRFVGTTAFKVVGDPRLTVTNDVIVYVAMGGGRGGV